jgi:hypothetical protein
LLDTLGLLSRTQKNVPGTASYDETLRSYLAACNTAMAHLWMSTAGNSRPVAAGTADQQACSTLIAGTAGAAARLQG